MMKRNVSKSTKKFAVLLLVPAFAVFLSAFAKPEYSYPEPAPAEQDKIVTVDSVVVIGAGSMDISTIGTKGVPTFVLGKGGSSNVTYYVDGKEVSSTEDLNPDDIHAISVLKDTAAIRLYGKESVVLIITKKYAQETGIENENKGISVGVPKKAIRIGTQKGESPLIIIDEKEYSGDVKEINPNEIESISVVKDSAAVAQYGEKGRKGVIFITTKAAAEAKTKTP